MGARSRHAAGRRSKSSGAWIVELGRRDGCAAPICSPRHEHLSTAEQRGGVRDARARHDAGGLEAMRKNLNGEILRQ